MFCSASLIHLLKLLEWTWVISRHPQKECGGRGRTFHKLVAVIRERPQPKEHVKDIQVDAIISEVAVSL